MKQKVYFAFFLFTLQLHAQKVCKGILIDSISRSPIEFANIGIVGKGIGTVTNENGEYSFILPDSLLNENVRVSIIGFKVKTFSAKEITQKNTIHLIQEATDLNEVAVSAKKLKIKTIGNVTTQRSVVAGFKKNNLGAELAVKLNIKNPQTQLRNFKLNIASNSLEKALFRLNIYSCDDKGYPKENILKQQIIIEPADKTGLIEVDLKPYGIFVDDDVFVSVEWIKDLGNALGLMFSSKLIGSGTYFRQASQDRWEKANTIGIGLHVEVGY
jgi:hypothetical protein